MTIEKSLPNMVMVCVDVITSTFLLFNIYPNFPLHGWRNHIRGDKNS